VLPALTAYLNNFKMKVLESKQENNYFPDKGGQIAFVLFILPK
jgi:hypothetical protein